MLKAKEKRKGTNRKELENQGPVRDSQGHTDKKRAESREQRGSQARKPIRENQNQPE